ncbi:MAG: rhamnogalacturonan acetylesterase [Lachnospiraceae bacterium]|nr:rhamnogalacturonan acetylesterase [Lachnospiraceae bacterium]
MVIHYSFSTQKTEGALSVTPSLLYGENQPYGFVTEQNRKSEACLKYPELTSAFDVPYWYQDTRLTNIQLDEVGCFLEEDCIPLCFQTAVPSQGNYLAAVTLTNPTDQECPFVLFTGRRRIAAIQTLAPSSRLTLSLVVNVTDIIPRGQNDRKADSTVTITLIGSRIRLTSVSLRPCDVPTLYIAGDSTVTDQSGSYPYRPEQCYSGWGQALPLYLNDSVALSNHAHSGLTTESFRAEGHHAIVLDYLKAGDYFFLQFAHNDQKLDHLKAKEGYRNNLIRYIDEIRSRGAYPVLVTPLGRNTWKGNDGTYNDLLAEYADTCRLLANEYRLPLIDLHKASTDFIKSHGLEDSRRYFFPGDYTHTNDYGAVMMAGYVAADCLKANTFCGYEALTAAMSIPSLTFTPPAVIQPAKPPQGFVDDRPKQSGPAFVQTIDRPDEPITRAEALALLIQAVHFFPTNVYNDMFDDVVGHEWYAGTIECAYQNGMIDPSLADGKHIHPNRPATLADFLSMAINACASRKTLPAGEELPVSCDVSDWLKPYLKTALALNWIDDSSNASAPLLRKDARTIAQKVSDMIG